MVDRSSDQFPHGIRMKGGVAFDPEGNGFIAIVHSWDNEHCLGEPEEWRSSRIFPTEGKAMRFYKKAVRPKLKRAMRHAAKIKGVSTRHTELER